MCCVIMYQCAVVVLGQMMLRNASLFYFTKHFFLSIVIHFCGIVLFVKINFNSTKISP